MDNDVIVWLWCRRVCSEIGIAGLPVKIIGVGLHVLCELREEQTRNEFADGFVSHGDRAWMDVDFDRGVVGQVLHGWEATGDQI